MFLQNLKRCVPLLVLVIVLATICLIPLKIISYGYLPGDDAQRFAAKAVSGKSWQEILVMRSDFAIDPSPGWQSILDWIHQLNGAGAETLVLFSMGGLMVLLMLCPLPWLRRPETWLGALLIAAVFVPACVTRTMRGRPYVLTDAVLVMTLLLWSRTEKDRPRPAALILTPLLVAASAWIHGSWYLLVLPGAAILFAGYWRLAMAYGVCWLAGSFLGCALTGHPVEFLFQAVRHMFGVFGNNTVNRQLISEFFPSDGQTPAVLAVAALLLWRKASTGWEPRAVMNPVFTMMVLGWVLGLSMQRFWWDWGIPAFMVWVALELQWHFERHVAADSLRRLGITLALAVAALIGFTRDWGGRWTQNLGTQYLTADDPALAGWMPDPGGIIYNSNMDVFFATFYKNPTQPWRYVLGFEPALMQPDDLAVLRAYQFNTGDTSKLEPWAKKMRLQDRMIINAAPGVVPNLPELEWNYAAADLWIGRLPRSTNNIPISPPSRQAGKT